MAGHLKRVAQATFHHALKAVAPAELVRSAVRVEGSKLFISNRLLKLDHIFDLTRISNLLIVGAGKASQELCHGLVSVLQGAQNLPLNIRAYINIPEGQPVHTLIDFLL
jgi:glycerate-2-kinase